MNLTAQDNGKYIELIVGEIWDLLTQEESREYTDHN